MINIKNFYTSLLKIDEKSHKSIDIYYIGYVTMKNQIKFNSDDNLPLNKTLKLHNMTILVRSVFEEDDKYYPQPFLDECLYEL